MAGGTISFNASVLNFDLKSSVNYSGPKGLDNYGFDTVSYDEPDYSKEIESKTATAQDINVPKKENNSDTITTEESQPKNAINAEFMKDKGINAFGWGLTKNFIVDKTTGSIFKSWAENSKFGWLAAPILEGTYKTLLEGGSNWANGEGLDAKNLCGVYVSGFTKAWASNIMKSDTFNAFVKKSAKFIYSKTLGKIKLPKGLSKSGLNKLLTKANLTDKWGSFSSVTSKFGTTLGIDYAASLLANIAKAKATGQSLTIETVKPGSTLLKSSTKIICATAFELICGKKGKVFGTAVGAFLGELQVIGFTDENGKVDENWCAKAGGAQIGGAVGGAAVAIYFASNPVGWVTGAAILVGAAIGYGITFIAYHWDDIYSWGENTVEAIHDAIDIAVDWVNEKVDVVVNYVEEKVNANPVANFLVGWAF